MANTFSAARPLILVVEDDPGVAALETELIEDLGCEVASVSSGKAVLEWLVTSTATPALMLMDYSLPDMNGMALLGCIAERCRTVPPFIVATGVGDEHLAVDLMRRGALNYLVKDQAFLDVLPTAIKRALSDLAMVQRLAAAERRSRLAARVLDGTSEGVFVSDEHYRIIETNPAFEAITGFSHDDAIGQMPTLLIGPSPEADQAMQMVMSALDEAGEWAGELVLRRKDGTQIFSWCNVSRIEGDTGELASFVTLFSDITQRKQIESELRVAATAFEAQEGMVITDAQRVILRVNSAFTRITGYTSDEVVGQTPRILNSGRHPPEFFAAMTDSLKKDGGWQGEIWNRRKNGEIYPEWLTITAVYGDGHRVINYVATLADITSRKQVEEDIKHLAFYDPLTSLPNRRLMTDRLRHAVAIANRNGRCGALMLLDLDNFKNLNDTLGHDAGDQLLVEVANRLEACVREGDTVSRLGGDEFVVILEGLEAVQLAAIHIEGIAVKILASLNNEYEIEVTEAGAGGNVRLRAQHQCSASIGIVLFESQEVTAEELLKRADTAMYEAKAAGRNTWCFFDQGMQAVISARAALEIELRHAIAEQQFLVYFQPQVNVSGQVVGAEVLVRWQHPHRGLVSPAEFIPVAEEVGLILPIGFWVLQQACQQLADWSKEPLFAHMTLAVNVSARQFRMPYLVKEVLSLLAASGAPADHLKLELTESMLLKNADDVIGKMNELRSHGVRFSLDDFGTGYSSLSYLKTLPLDQLKIDQSFVRDVLTDPNDAAIARTVVALADALGLAVIAEGVETEDQREFLSAVGCLCYQGYLFSRPVPVAEFEAYVRRLLT